MQPRAHPVTRNTPRALPTQALDDAEYNARAFAHPAPPKAGHPRAGRAVARPRIWHWHGYKPQDVACWLEAMRRGSWPARGWRAARGVPFVRICRLAGPGTMCEADTADHGVV